jgi:uncharacterized protein YdaU (DUF1376 family)
MSKPDSWMKFFPGDYLRDTMHLSALEHGCYLLLIMAAWTNGGSFCEDDIPGIIKMSDKKSQKTIQKLRKFFTEKNGLWTHKRVVEELTIAHERYLNKVNAGRKGAAKRWSKPMADPLAEGMGNQCQPESESEPEPEEEESKSKTLVRLFPEFWNSYPIKKAKAPALKSYERAIKSGISHITLMAGVDRAIRMDPKWAEGYIPHAATWLNQKRWEDEFETAGIGIGGRSRVTPGAAAALRVLERLEHEDSFGGSDQGIGGAK